MSSPTKACRYGSLCFRLNPSHFDEYQHPHLDAIIKKGINRTTGEYDIPSGCPKDKVTGQLNIIKSKSTESQAPPAKIPKIEVKENSVSPPRVVKKMFVSSPVTPTNSAPCVKTQSTLKQSFLTSPVAPKASPKVELKPFNSPGMSSLQKKQEDTNFFKERAAAFKAKNPEQMRAPSPPAPTTSENTFNPTKEKDLEAVMHKFLPVILPKGRMKEKLRNAAPYNMFLTTVTAAPQTHSDPLSVTFQELLDASLGDLESSVQLNFMVDIGWLLAQYAFAKCSQQPLLILYGQDMPGLREINQKRPNVTAVKVNIPTPIGCHHTKMSLLFYKDNSMRVVVSTANLYEDDWDNRVQGLWISDRLPSLDEAVSHINNGESSTKFREDLIRYLIFYNIPKLQPVISKIKRTDFSSVNVFFVSSVPGTHRDSGRGIHYGHPRVASLLVEHSAPVDDSNPIILQASSIGSLGSSAQAYLTGEIANSFKRDSAPVGIRRLPHVKLIYPSLNNVITSHDGMAGGGCLPYNGQTHDKQRWLNEHLYQWRSSSRNRNQAMPHIKSYCRYSDRGLYWFILTSANLSRSAWGVMNKNNKTLNPSLRINSYEAGVVFFPQVILGKPRFPMNETQQKDDAPVFKIPYDVPLLPYGKDDVPYCAEYLKDYLKKYGA